MLYNTTDTSALTIDKKIDNKAQQCIVQVMYNMPRVVEVTPLDGHLSHPGCVSVALLAIS